MANDTKPVIDLAAVQHFEKMVQDALAYAQSMKMPLTIVEGTMRDIIAKVEARRLLFELRQLGAKL